ncbi:FAD-binding protein [Schumannella sp. 10F1B-5-1]|nr:FAD-linked oxidase C-terminal domain-containing protein [Schumannella sp. 10F1B-5-1]TPW71091.1 FAD-binding protein [Schumannella sp. 10F1B-5-1]
MDTIRDELAELGDALVLEPAALDAVRADKSGHASAARPLALVEARSVEHVQATMRFATKHGIPVVPRGAGTGLAGGAIGGAGEIVVSVRHMDRILEVSVDDELAVVEPGIVNTDLNARLADQGLWWAPDPASKAISTVGGNIATNAGGLLCVKYGVTREAVLALKVVLADGRLISTGHRTVKGVTGLDLTALLIGSEGLLGIVVEATLKLRRLPEGEPVTIGATFADVTAAARAAAVIATSAVRPAVLELIDERAVGMLAAWFAGRGEQVDLGTGAYLLVQTDGADAQREAQDLLPIIASLGGRATLAADAAEGERLLRIRRSFHPTLESHGTVLIEDVAVPRSALPAMFAEIQRIEREHGIPIPTIAHAGDGNLHPNFVVPRGADGVDVEVPEEVWDAAGALFQAALRLGGTLTGEHGVGILKKRWLGDEIGDTQLELQRGIKAVFDPQGLLNPGKVL